MKNSASKSKKTRATTTKSKAVRAKNTKHSSTKSKVTKPPNSKRVSMLDAAYRVLKECGQSMRARELIDAMATRGLWISPAGKTPHATLYAAMFREVRGKGRESRFRQLDRGLFEANHPTD